MKRLLILSLIAGIILGGLYLTNPEKEDFKNFFERVMEEHAADIPEEYTGALEQSGLKLGSVATMASMMTVRQDYIFFSTYEMKIPGQKMKFIGIATFFVPLEKP